LINFITWAFPLANGPGFPLQVLAFPARTPSTRCGLYTAIPNATQRAISKIYFERHHDFFRGALVDTRNDVFSLLHFMTLFSQVAFYKPFKNDKTLFVETHHKHLTFKNNIATMIANAVLLLH
jgi:hypothetical protein